MEIAIDISILSKHHKEKIEIDKEISMCVDIRTMPASLRRHNLARLRDALNLTQSALGRAIGKSAGSIKAVEIGKLALSPKMALLISRLTGCDPAWLMRNDLSEPMPELRRLVTLNPEDEAHRNTMFLLAELFSRLFACAHQLAPSPKRDTLAAFIEKEAKAFRENAQELEPVRVGVSALEFFKDNPEYLALELGRLFNLDYLLGEAVRAARAENELFSLNDSANDGKPEASARLKPQAVVETRLPQGRKSPRRNPGSPSRVGRGKKPKSS
jgi:transcriptional regulator with XRE-family HTH domain